MQQLQPALCGLFFAFRPAIPPCCASFHGPAGYKWKQVGKYNLPGNDNGSYPNGVNEKEYALVAHRFEPGVFPLFSSGWEGKMKRISPAFVFVMTLFSVSLPVHADVFKCRDAAGKVTYSDTGCAVGTAGASIPLQENTVDSYGDRLLMEEQAYSDHRPGSGGAVASPGGSGGVGSATNQTTVTPRYRQSSYYDTPYYPSSSSSTCNSRACQSGHEEKTVRAQPESRSNDSGHSGADRGHDSPSSGRSSDSGKSGSKTVRAVDKDKDKN